VAGLLLRQCRYVGNEALLCCDILGRRVLVEWSGIGDDANRRMIVEVIGEGCELVALYVMDREVGSVVVESSGYQNQFVVSESL